MYERIVAAIDSHTERAAKVLGSARELALAGGGEVLVVHVRDIERPMAMVTPLAKAGAIPPAVHFESEESARALVDGAVEGLRSAGVQASGEVGSGVGSTARELLDIAQIG